MPRVPLIFGTMTIGEPGKNGVRTDTLDGAQEILNVFFKHGGKEIDTARMYAEGTTEACLSKLDLHGATVDTKVYPVNPGDHHPDKLRATFQTSLDTLGPNIKPRVFYLHAPDRSVPFKDTLAAVDALYKEGKFEIFGLSNYAAWEVAEIIGLCTLHNYVQPKIYQAMYNPITRAIEDELVPCLRKNNIRLVVYNPLAGGYLAGKVKDGVIPEGRFSGESGMAKMYRARYLQGAYAEALETIRAVADKHQFTMTEIALRWMQHHSALTPSDGVILGASSPQQLDQTCTESERGELPQDVLDALDLAWNKVGVNCPKYWR
ncbi:Aldo/keto reductase [Serendipita vermifera]|nr:Aldo/keto reductase [Serendipita vermifera]